MMVKFSLKFVRHISKLGNFCLILIRYFWGRLCFLREASVSFFNVFQMIGSGLPTLPRLGKAYPYHQIWVVLYKGNFSVTFVCVWLTT